MDNQQMSQQFQGQCVENTDNIAQAVQQVMNNIPPQGQNIVNNVVGATQSLLNNSVGQQGTPMQGTQSQMQQNVMNMGMQLQPQQNVNGSGQQQSMPQAGNQASESQFQNNPYNNEGNVGKGISGWELRNYLWFALVLLIIFGIMVAKRMGMSSSNWLYLLFEKL